MAVTAAASAFADAPSKDKYDITGGLTGTYTTSSNDITSLQVGGQTVELQADSQVTFLVYKKGADATEVKAEDVIGIDQGTTIQPTNKGLKDGSVTETAGTPTTYVVKVGYTPAGGQFTVAEGTFTVGEAAYIVGDADGSGKISGADAMAIIDSIMEITIIEPGSTNFKAADLDSSGKLTGSEAMDIIDWVVENVNRESSPIGKPPVA